MQNRGASSISMIQIAFEIPFGLPLTSDNGIVKTDTDQIKIFLDVKRRTESTFEGKTDEDIPKFTTDPSTRLWNDRFGQTHYTTAKFQFQINPEISYDHLFDEIGRPKQFGFSRSYLDKSIEATNKLLNACRIISGRYCPRNFTRADIATYGVTYHDSLGNVVFKESSIGTGANYFGSHQLLNDIQLDELNAMLKNNINISVEDELKLNAEDHLIFENTRMACIEIQSAVERIIAKVITKHLTGLHKTPQEIEEVLKNRLDDLKPYLSNVSNTITNGIEWQNWKIKCYKIRNDVVHRGVIPNLPTTKESVDAGKNFINFLNKFS